MKKRFLAFLIVGVALAAMGIAGTAPAATVPSNVAAFQPTEGTEVWGFLTEWGNDNSYHSTTHGDDNDDSYWRVDLGQEYTIDHLDIYARTDGVNDYSARTNGATLRAYTADGETQVGDDIVLAGHTFEETKVTYNNDGAGWTGVQYFQVGGEDISVQYLHVAEFEAYAEVDLYPGFIQGITVTATETYGPHAGISPAFLVDNSGMMDQRTTLGDPTATHYNVVGGALWHSWSNPATDPVVTFDLGGKYDLTDMFIWNEHQSDIDAQAEGPGARCVKEALIEYSSNGIDYTPLPDSNFDELGNHTLQPTDGYGGPYLATDSIDLDTLGVEASHIRLTAHSSWGDDPEFEIYNYRGLSEVRFYGEEIPSEEIPGDATEDGNVNSLDAQRLAMFWGATELEDGYTWWQMGDFNKDLTIGPADAAIMAANWGYGPGEAEAGAVPEPSTLVLLGSVLALALLKRRVF